MNKLYILLIVYFFGLFVGCSDVITPEVPEEKIVYSKEYITNITENESYGVTLKAERYKYVVISFDSLICKNPENSSVSIINGPELITWFGDDINISAKPYEIYIYTNSYHEAFIILQSSILNNIEVFNFKIKLEETNED